MDTELLILAVLSGTRVCGSLLLLISCYLLDLKLELNIFFYELLSEDDVFFSILTIQKLSRFFVCFTCKNKNYCWNSIGSLIRVLIIKWLYTFFFQMKLAGAQFSTPNLKIQQAKNFSVMQAQQDGCLASYKTFDSHFGNYLLPVIPSYADLFSENIASKSNHSLPKQWYFTIHWNFKWRKSIADALYTGLMNGIATSGWWWKALS